VAALLLIAAIVLCFAASWVVLPPFHIGLMPLTIGAPELSPWLLAAALLVCALAFRSSSADATARATLYIAAAAAALFAYPLARVPFAINAFDRAMEQGLGDSYEDRIPTVARFELRTHVLLPLDFVRGIAERDVLVRRGIEFARPAGVPLMLDVYRPRSAGLHPMLVQIYGGAWQRGSPDDDSSFASWFASRGYVVVGIDYRHAPAYRWPAQIEDVRSAIGWLLAHAGELEADTQRIALIGRSAGGQLALVAAYQGGLPVRAVVSYYGPTDLPEGWRKPPRPDPIHTRPVLETFLGGRPDSLPVAYHDASAVNYASARVPPTLLIHGSRDHIVEPRFGRELHDALRNAGAISVLLEMPWADHAFDLPNGISAQISLYYTERFLAWALR
jgi:acetyl esterase/lipase